MEARVTLFSKCRRHKAGESSFPSSGMISRFWCPSPPLSIILRIAVQVQMISRELRELTSLSLDSCDVGDAAVRAVSALTKLEVRDGRSSHVGQKNKFYLQ